jgi:hypothetical protein
VLRNRLQTAGHFPIELTRNRSENKATGLVVLHDIRSWSINCYQKIFSQPITSISSERSLPTHNDAVALRSQPSTVSISKRTGPLYMLTCMENRHNGMTVTHDHVDHIKTDRLLFTLLRELYGRKRRYLQSLLSMRTLRSINLVKVSRSFFPAPEKASS